MKFNLEVTIYKICLSFHNMNSMCTTHSKFVIIVGTLKGGRADWLVEKCTVCLYVFLYLPAVPREYVLFEMIDVLAFCLTGAWG